MSVHVSSWAWSNSTATAGTLLVLLALADMANDEAKAWPSQKSIGQRARLTPRQVRRCLKTLEDSGEIQAIGKTSSGTIVWSIVGYLQGADNLSPRTPTSAPSGHQRPVEADTDVLRSVSEPSDEPSIETTRVRGMVVALRGDVAVAPAWKVDRKPVSEAENGLARAVLATWNEMTGQTLTAREWLAKIILRVREHPELDLDDHEHVISVALKDPWWSGPASPSVIYGNGAQFERCIEQVRFVPRAGRPERYGRGLSARQVGEMFGEGGAA